MLVEIDHEIYQRLVKDAERYRWLRQDGGGEHMKGCWWDDFGIVRLGYDDYSHATGEKLDDAIDAGMKSNEL